MLLLYLMYMISELIKTEINYITHMLHLPFAVCVYIYIYIYKPTSLTDVQGKSW